MRLHSVWYSTWVVRQKRGCKPPKVTDGFMDDLKNVCKVCGLHFPEFFPWGETGETPSHDICDCCGIEFGYEDNNVESVRVARKKWLVDGANWFNPENKPSVWNPNDQLKNIPPEFL